MTDVTGARREFAFIMSGGVMDRAEPSEPAPDPQDEYDRPLGHLSDGSVVTSRTIKASGMEASACLRQPGATLTDLGRDVLALLASGSSTGSEKSRLVTRAHKVGIDDARIRQIEEAAANHKMMGKPVSALEALKGEVEMYEAARASKSSSSGTGGVRGL